MSQVCFTRGLSTLWLGLLASFLLLAPLVHWLPYWHNQQRLMEVALAVAGLLMLVLGGGFSWSRRWAVPMLILSGLGLISAMDAQWPLWAGLELSLYAVLLVIGVATMHAVRAQGVAEGLRSLAAALAVAVLAWLLVKAVFVLALLQQGQLRLLPEALRYGFDNVRFLAQFQVASLPVLLVLAWQLHSPALRAGLLLLALAWVWCAVFFGSRGALVGFGVEILAFLWLGGKDGRRFAASLGGLLLLAWLLDSALWQLDAWREAFRPALADLRHEGQAFSDRGRFVLWAAAWESFMHSPWLGLGPMHFAGLQIPSGAHPHNALLQWLAEWGGAASFLWLALALRFLGDARRAITADLLMVWPRALLVALLGMLCLSLVDGVLVMPYAQVLLAVLGGGLAAVFVETGGGAAVAANASFWSRALCGLIALLVLGAGMFVLFNLNEAAVPVSAGIKPSPRFWADGYLP